MTTLYPPIFNGSYGYKTEWDRASLIVGESLISCNVWYLSSAYNNGLYSYFFAMPPSQHGIDNIYTYYDGGEYSTTNATKVMNPTVAIVLQQLVTSFSKSGVPKAEGVEEFRKYGEDAWMLELHNGTRFEGTKDRTSAERCKWWQEVQYS
jgi:hypothetical protein